MFNFEYFKINLISILQAFTEITGAHQNCYQSDFFYSENKQIKYCNNLPMQNMKNKVLLIFNEEQLS